jgi:hypothetical protein
MFQDYSQKIVRKEKPMDPMFVLCPGAQLRTVDTGGASPTATAPRNKKILNPVFGKSTTSTLPLSRIVVPTKILTNIKIYILHLRDKSDNV